MVLVKVLANNGETVSAVCARLGHPHSKGCGFYLLTKKENISADKEIILWTGAKFIQDAKLARKELGFGAGAITVQPTQVPDGHELYVQSTSATRKLAAGPVLLRVPKLPAAAATASNKHDDDDGAGDGEEEEEEEEEAKAPARSSKRKREDEPKSTSTSTSTSTSAVPSAKRAKVAKVAATPSAPRVAGGQPHQGRSVFASKVALVPHTDDLSTIEFYDEPAGEAFAEERVPARFLAAASQKVFEAAHAAAQDWKPDATAADSDLLCWHSPSTLARLWFHDAKHFAALEAPQLHFSVALALGSSEQGDGASKAFIRTPDFSYDAELDPENFNYAGASLTDFPVGLLACLAHGIWELGAHHTSADGDDDEE